MRLTREIRCFPHSDPLRQQKLAPWAGLPGNAAQEIFWVLRLTVEGPVDPQTGYMCDIRAIDAHLRGQVVPELMRHVTSPDPSSVEAAMLAAWPIAQQARPEGGEVVKLELVASPFLRFFVLDGEKGMVSVTQSFEFAAAHRLYCADLSDEENLRIFGRCSNPNGHGHNYVLEVTVTGEPDATTGKVLDLADMHTAVSERVLSRFDHKHLNLDCPDFATQNPSVENIARVIWQRLEGAFDRAKLATVRVWETAKTSAEYSGND